jgi:hypothetical protein
MADRQVTAGKAAFTNQAGARYLKTACHIRYLCLSYKAGANQYSIFSLAEAEKVKQPAKGRLLFRVAHGY